MLLPDDYSPTAISDPAIAKVIHRLEVVPGGEAYDSRYPEGIPTSVIIEHRQLGTLGGELVMFPLGHARSDKSETARLVDLKFERLVANAVTDPTALRQQVALTGKSVDQVANLYNFPIDGIEGS